MWPFCSPCHICTCEPSDPSATCVHVSLLLPLPHMYMWAFCSLCHICTYEPSAPSATYEYVSLLLLLPRMIMWAFCFFCHLWICEPSASSSTYIQYQSDDSTQLFLTFSSNNSFITASISKYIFTTGILSIFRMTSPYFWLN